MFAKLKLLLFLLFGFINTACASTSLNIKPVDFYVFSDQKILALDESGNYQIGSLDTKWSATFKIQNKGLSLLDAVVTRTDGILLVGSEARKDKDNSVYYTGLVVLIDSTNKTVQRWRTDTSFLKAVHFKNKSLLSTFTGIYQLDREKGIQLVKPFSQNREVTLLYDQAGEAIYCRPASMAKNNRHLTSPPGCNKENGWSFRGLWYSANESFHTDPIICGSWLVEPVQKRFREPFTKLKVRDTKTGKLVKEQKIPDSTRFFCVNNSHILLSTGQHSYKLPEMQLQKTSPCGKGNGILQIRKVGNSNICLTNKGAFKRINNN